MTDKKRKSIQEIAQQFRDGDYTESPFSPERLRVLNAIQARQAEMNHQAAVERATRIDTTIMTHRPWRLILDISSATVSFE